jgi:hypothetical protein
MMSRRFYNFLILNFFSGAPWTRPSGYGKIINLNPLTQQIKKYKKKLKID